jgi:N6-adenosine-specific RNA methylase IME4
MPSTSALKRYRTIVADPPWTPDESVRSHYADRKAYPQKHYETMSTAAICSLQPPSDDSAHLWLWTLTRHVDWGYSVARAWGFEPLTMVTWCKPSLGAGRFQCNTEHVLLCRKGSREAMPFGRTGGTWFKWPRGAHSAKPDAFYDLVEKASPGPYLELFARRARMGDWHYWGDESLGTAELPEAAA